MASSANESVSRDIIYIRDNFTGWSGCDNAPEAKSESIAVPIDSIDVTSSPRSVVDHTHVMIMNDIEAGSLPPIVVQRGSMRIVDGLHRWHAAKRRGDETINVVYFDGGDDLAFLTSIALNARHGLPLSLSDRRNAAKRVLLEHPDWSDRAIAALAGLSNKTVGGVRSDLGSALPTTDRRTGLNGVAQPTNPAVNRAKAEAILDIDPDASVSEIAKRAGVSVTTAKSTRDRKRKGSAQTTGRSVGGRSAATVNAGTETASGAGYYRQILVRLSSDPSIRFSQYGRILFRLLEGGAREQCDWDELASNIPLHCRAAVAELARLQAGYLARFASAIEDGTAAAMSSSQPAQAHA